MHIRFFIVETQCQLLTNAGFSLIGEVRTKEQVHQYSSHGYPQISNIFNHNNALEV